MRRINTTESPPSRRFETVASRAFPSAAASLGSNTSKRLKSPLQARWPTQPPPNLQGFEMPMSSNPQHPIVDELFENLRKTQADTMGFWNAGAERDTWRLVASHRPLGAQSIGHESESAATIEWKHPTAHVLINRMLGIDSPEFHPLIDPNIAFRTLAFHLIALSPLDPAFAEASHSMPVQPFDPGSARYLAFDLESIENLAAGFILAAQAIGGTVRFSSPKLQTAAEAKARGKTFEIDWNQLTVACERVEAHDILATYDPKDRNRRGYLDIRRLARQLGLPMKASLARPPGILPIGNSFISAKAINKAIDAEHDRFMGVSLPPAMGTGTSGGMQAYVEAFQSLYEAETLKSLIANRDRPMNPEGKRPFL